MMVLIKCCLDQKFAKIIKNNILQNDPDQFGKFVKKKVCLERLLARFAKQFFPKKASAIVRKVNMKKIVSITDNFCNLRHYITVAVREGWRYQIGWIFGKVPKGGGRGE